MTDETPPEDRRLSKFSNADRRLAYSVRQPQTETPPLERMLEVVMREQKRDAIEEDIALPEHIEEQADLPPPPSAPPKFFSAHRTYRAEDIEPSQEAPPSGPLDASFGVTGGSSSFRDTGFDEGGGTALSPAVAHRTFFGPNGFAAGENSPAHDIPRQDATAHKAQMAAAGVNAPRGGFPSNTGQMRAFEQEESVEAWPSSARTLENGSAQSALPGFLLRGAEPADGPAAKNLLPAVLPTSQVRGRSVAVVAGMASRTAQASRSAATFLGPRAVLLGLAAGRALEAFGKAAGRLHPMKMRRSYYSAASVFHRRIFDRKIEKLLFKKSGAVDPGAGLHPASGPSAMAPRLAVEWALSLLPADLKQFAFSDFNAGSGRALLLASRCNFHHAVGYVFGHQAYEDLRLNVEQYPRSRMACRDVRIVRGDHDGISIPQQPAVLFMPASIREGHLDIIMSHISASYRINPRRLYLIFENAVPGYAVPYRDIFEPIKAPLSVRFKMGAFNPARTLVYTSRGDGSSHD